MNWNHRIRQTHRWVTYSPLAPPAVLQFTGLYLFALPYVAKRRDGREAT